MLWIIFCGTNVVPLQNKRNDMANEIYKEEKLTQIWNMLEEVTTDICYSSILCEKRSEAQNGIFFWIIYLCIAFPSVLSLLIKIDVIQNVYMVWAIILVSLVIPIVLKYKNKQLIYSIFGVYDQKSNQLLDLNSRLETYKNKLASLYVITASMNPTPSQIREIDGRYDSLTTEYQDAITLHDKLTGEIDQDIQKEAQIKAGKLLEGFLEYNSK